MKVLITGASSGIGRELARLLAPESTTLILVARDADALKKVQTEIATAHPNVTVTVHATDLSVPENCVALHDAYPDVDFLINNAGFGDFGRFTETELSKDLAMINTNIVAVHILCKLYLKEMTARNHGQIMNTASIAGFLPGPLMATYYATKNYVVRLSEAIREELRRQKSAVKISVLCPGPVSTNFEKTANIQFNFRGISSHYVAKYALAHRRQFYIVPQKKIRFARFGAKLLPSATVAKVVYRIQANRR